MIRTLAALSSSLLILLVPPPCTSFTPALTRSSVSSSIIHRGKDFSTLNLSKNDDNQNESKNPLELASWYAVEAFGKAFGSKNSVDGGNNQVSDSIDFTKAPSSLDETLKRIQIDNDRSYFLSGEVDRLIYDEACTFADPFVAFDGRDRFIDNLSNLGSFITNYDAKMIKYDVEDEGREIVTKVMVKLELNLPWKPVLAWPWGVSYSVDPDTFLVTVHRESWDIEPLEGVKQIFRRPTVKVSNK
mmetsp:Transcript_1525/g.3250  ORF Transcript_1525/g.3250 Transcript_1525/m.3250 type:complete len:244 (+) Transcript_1525:222-953(+)